MLPVNAQKRKGPTSLSGPREVGWSRGGAASGSGSGYGAGFSSINAHSWKL
jgi:hypothetical protein